MGPLDRAINRLVNILIIGGSRFVGPYVIQKLLTRGHQVTVFNRGTRRTDYGKDVRFIQGDRDRDLHISDHFDAVADTCPYRGEQTQHAITALNFDFFAHFSSATVYGKPELFPLKEDHPFGRWAVWGDYGDGKVACEEVLASSGISYAAIRAVYVLGPDNYCDRERFIYSRMKAGDPIHIPGNGEAVCQFTFVEDVADAFVHVVENGTAGGLNCGGDELITLNGLVKEMATIVGAEANIINNPSTDGAHWNDQEFPFANENLFVSNDRMRALGLQRTPLLEGLRRDYEGHYKAVV